ncbi:MAG: FHA domain-containing protein, partial [Cyanothece sp. SIO1E1]|nr:FHA domain-containing protein [Cyanothece sp. SIO1E1]
ASFCGQCGFDLRTASSTQAAATIGTPPPPLPSPPEVEIPDLPLPDPLVEPEVLSTSSPDSEAPKAPKAPGAPMMSSPDLPPDPPAAEPAGQAEVAVSSPPDPIPAEPVPAPTVPPAPLPVQPRAGTQIQQQTVQLLHIQTDTSVELPQNLTLIHIGKPNDRVPPDIDVSGFPNSEIVSRIHADIRVEGDTYYIEDMSSSNGTYINNSPLPVGNRHRLRPGDRIALGKGDKVSFLFQIVQL